MQCSNGNMFHAPYHPPAWHLICKNYFSIRRHLLMFALLGWMDALTPSLMRRFNGYSNTSLMGGLPVAFARFLPRWLRVQAPSVLSLSLPFLTRLLWLLHRQNHGNHCCQSPYTRDKALSRNVIIIGALLLWAPLPNYLWGFYINVLNIFLTYVTYVLLRKQDLGLVIVWKIWFQ